jgi:hypothetical protein
VKNLKFEIISSGKFKGTVKRTEISWKCETAILIRLVGTMSSSAAWPFII